MKTSDKLFPGCFLISEPFLTDPHFHRTVILIAEHVNEGTVGYVLNQPVGLNVTDFFPEFSEALPLFHGGPVSKDSLHFITLDVQVPGAKKIAGNLFWNGDFEALSDMLKEGTIAPEQVKIFIGYSGWSEGQLTNELEQKAWIVCEGNNESVFSRSGESLWKHILKQLGGTYSWLANAPTDPSLN